jgi:hypothetical protein
VPSQRALSGNGPTTVRQQRPAVMLAVIGAARLHRASRRSTA